MSIPSINSTNVLWCKLNATNNASTGGVVTDFYILLGTNYGWITSENAIRSDIANTGTSNFCGFRLASNFEAGGAGLGGVVPPALAVDGSAAAGDGKRLFYTHIYSSTGYGLAGVDAVGSTGYGDIFFLVDSNNAGAARNCRGWCSGGSDSIPVFMSAHPMSFVCVDATWSGTEVEVGTSADKLKHIDVTTSGYEFDPTDIVSAAFGYTNQDTGQYAGTFNRFGYYDAYTALGGVVDNPGTFRDFKDKAESELHYAFCQGDGEQWRARMAIEFGDADLTNTLLTYFDDRNGSLNFATRPTSLTSPLARPFHGPDNKLGMEAKLRSVDTFRLTNYQLSSGTPWHLRFASSVGATVEFINCVIQNAGGTDDDCEIDTDVLISGGLIDACGKLAVNEGTIENASITNPANGSAIEITEDSNLSNVSFSTETGGVDRAIEIPDPFGGTYNYTFDNLTFDGFDFDVRVEGTISGTVNISVTNGGDTPTIDAGTITNDTPSLLGSGWIAGTPYTTVSGGGDTKRCAFVVVSNDGSKAATGCTFGGEIMSLAETQVQNSIGLSLFYLLETGNTSVFSSSQTISASYSGGTPSNITYQSSTYDHILQTTPLKNTDSDGNSKSDGASSVTVLDTWQHAAEITSDPTFTISAGNNRCLVVIVNHEDNGQNPGPTGVTWGGKALTKAVSNMDGDTYNYSSIWILNEADIDDASGTTLIISGTSGDNPSYGAALFQGVNQSALPNDFDSDLGSNPSVSTLSLTIGDMVVGSFASTGGANSSSWDNVLSTPDESFADNTADDPSEGAYKAYSGGDTSTGVAGASGGDTNRTIFCVVVLSRSGGEDAGDLDLDVNTSTDDLIISAMQASEVITTVSWDGDATKRLETDRSNETVSVADYVETAGGSANMGFSNVITASGVDSQILLASFSSSYESINAPTVNVNNSVDVTIIVKDAITKTTVSGVMVLLEEDPGGTDIIKTTTDVNGKVTTNYNFTTDQDVIGVARKSSITPFYKEGIITGTISSSGFESTVLLTLDE